MTQAFPKTKPTFAKRIDIVPSEFDVWMFDYARTADHVISWGFWFGNDARLREWADEYTPEWKLTEAVIIQIAFNKTFDRADVRKRLSKQWMVSTPSSGEQAVYKLAPFSEFIGVSDSTQKIAEWADASMKEILPLIGRST